MKISRLLRISCEFFPPKTPDGLQHLKNAAAGLAGYKPDFFSVTYGAGGSTRDGTLSTVKMLQEDTNIEIAPHIACIGASQYDLLKILHAYKANNVRRIVALRGDLPRGLENLGELNYACELIQFIRENTGDVFDIEVAAYPEIHPQALSADADILNLKNKQAVGANTAITQYFFNPDAYFYLLDECEKHQITMPIIPGIMPITQFAKLARFSDACGAEIPRWIRRRLEAYGEDEASVKAFGFEVIYQLCERLIRGGAPGLHFYTLNRAEATLSLLKALIGKELVKLPIVEESPPAYSSSVGKHI